MEKDIDEIMDEVGYNQKAKPTLEADASSNIVGYYKGYRFQITKRNPSIDMTMFIDRAITEIEYMISKGCKPSWADDKGNVPQATQTPAVANPSASQTPTMHCPIHDVMMRQFTKEGRPAWYSHSLDGKWCSGKGYK